MYTSHHVVHLKCICFIKNKTNKKELIKENINIKYYKINKIYMKLSMDYVEHILVKSELQKSTFLDFLSSHFCSQK